MEKTSQASAWWKDCKSSRKCKTSLVFLANLSQPNLLWQHRRHSLKAQWGRGHGLGSSLFDRGESLGADYLPACASKVAFLQGHQRQRWDKEGFLSPGRFQVGHCPPFKSGSSLNFPLQHWMSMFVFSIEEDGSNCSAASPHCPFYYFWRPGVTVFWLLVARP